MICEAHTLTRTQLLHAALLDARVIAHGNVVREKMCAMLRTEATARGKHYHYYLHRRGKCVRVSRDFVIHFPAMLLHILYCFH